MKTAMREAIELVKKYDSKEIPIKVLLYNLELLVEKEKNEIIDASNSAFEDKTSWGERYYNQTYNN